MVIAMPSPHPSRQHSHIYEMSEKCADEHELVYELGVTVASLPAGVNSAIEGISGPADLMSIRDSSP